MAIDRHEQIRRRAYEIWEREGRPEGADLRHWQQASDEVDTDDTEPPSSGDDRDDAALLQGAGESGDFDRPGGKSLRSKKVPKDTGAPVSTQPEVEITTGERPSRQKIKKTEGP
jgi:hypothetical protein